MYFRIFFFLIRVLLFFLNIMVGFINLIDVEFKIKFREYNRYKRFRYILLRIYLRYSFGVFEI